MCVSTRKLIRSLVLSGALALGLADVARATPIVGISGPDNPFGFPGFSIGAPRATQWQSTLALEDVTVTADLSSAPGITGTATAFLTTKVGPGTTVADEIAHVTFSLPDFSAPSHTVTLFTGLDLAPANYYLMVTVSAGTSAIWYTSDSSQMEFTPCPTSDIPCPFTIGAGNPAFPNWQMFTVAPNAYAPASVWTPFTFGFGAMHFAVDGTIAQDGPPTEPPVPPSVPEPGTITLMLTGLAAGARKLRAKRNGIRGGAA